MIDELRPELIDLSIDAFEFNYQQIERLSVASALMYENNLVTMLKHLRGELLETHTTVLQISDSTENKLVATQTIPIGSILGLYFGKVYSMDKPELSKPQWDITRYETILDDAGNKLEMVRIVGEVDGKLTRMATINHAYSKEIAQTVYTFVNDDVINQIGFCNIRSINLKFYLKTKKEIKQVQINAYVTSQTINPGEALLVSYDNPTIENPIPAYWASRGCVPLLFTQSGDFLPTELYSSKSLPLFSTVQAIVPQATPVIRTPIKIGRLVFIVIFILAIALFVKYATQ